MANDTKIKIVKFSGQKKNYMGSKQRKQNLAPQL